MPFSPDIIVTDEDTSRILLAVEAKLSSTPRKDDVSQLKTYMLHMKCPIGLLVTPDVIEVFRDTYTEYSENSVKRVGSFPSPNSWDIFQVPHHGSREPQLELRFEEAVKFWLEQLGASPSAHLIEFPKETREALADYVVPAVTQGVVRSTGPRESLKSH